MSERTGRPARPIAQELKAANAKIQTLLDRRKEQIIAEWQVEIEKDEVQADRYRRSVRKLINIESQQKELQYAQTKEHQRQDQQLLH